MLAIGFFYSRGIKNTEDYFLSGRRFGAFPIAATLAVSFIGGGMFMGVTGFLARYGIATILIAIGMALSFILLGVFFGPRLRRLNVSTLPQFIGKRFDEKTRLLIAIMTILGLISATAIQLKASGAILNTVFNMPYFWAILFSAFFVTLYTVIGGFRSVVATDVVQIIIIFIGLIVALPFILAKAGDIGNVMAVVAKSQDGQFFNLFSQGILFVVGVFIMLLIFSVISAENHQRLYAAKDAKAARNAGIYAGIFYFVILAVIFFIGILGIYFYPALDNPDNFFPRLAVDLLPAWLGGILLSAVAAGIMSSADTNLVTCGSIVVTDFYQQSKNATTSQKKLINLSRLVIIAIAILSIIMAFIFPTVVDLMLYYNSMMASVAIVPITFGLFWKRATGQAAFWSGIAGGGSNIAVLLMGADPAKSAIPSILVACVVLVVFSLKKKKTLLQRIT